MRKTKETSMATIENHASQKQTFEWDCLNYSLLIKS
jgi:hypothetical protein